MIQQLIAFLALGSAAGTIQSGNWTAYDDADAKLTAAYGALASQLPLIDRHRLRDEERAWIKVRNQVCGFEARNRCALIRTRQRTAELERRIVRSEAYRALPDGELLQLERKLDEACKSSGQDPGGSICTRRDAVYRLLRSRGWCWGSADPRTSAEADMYWLSCSKDATGANR